MNNRYFFIISVLAILSICYGGCNDASTSNSAERERTTSTTTTSKYSQYFKEYDSIQTDSSSRRVERVSPSKIEPMSYQKKAKSRDYYETIEERKFNAVKYAQAGIVDVLYESGDAPLLALDTQEMPPPNLKDIKLPQGFFNRKFLVGGSQSTYDIFLLPGNIIEYDPTGKTYKLLTPVPLLRGYERPKMEAIQDGMIYQNVVASEKAGSFSVCGIQLGGEKNTIVEFIIQDVAKSAASSELIDLERLGAAKKSLTESQLNNCYFIQSAVLTVINHRSFKTSKFSSKVQQTWITMEGKAFGSNLLFSRDRIISCELVSLKDMLNIR